MKARSNYLRGKSISGPVTRLLATAFAFFFPLLLFSQTTNISGIVNSYYRVIQNVPARSALRLDNTSGLGYGNLVLIIQMKGATIQTANTINYGDTLNLNGAGSYEIATICAVRDDSVFFFNDLLNSYDTAHKVQLIKFAEYYSANVTGTVKPASWDSTTGTGGVIAIRTEETLTLNAAILADSTGYNGGGFLIHSGTCNNFSPATGYAYDGNNTGSNLTGAFKGEGVAIFTATEDGGRGAPANGGGGGNNHNNGGAGGANLAAGGNGGGNYTTVSGACTGARQGLGGKALSSWSGNKLFMGGGGGAGNVNNNVPTHAGGDGGGIIIIIAKDIVGNGQKISANGRIGGNGGSDGASGGGAGGTIVMHVQNSYSGLLTVEANGGTGGTANNQSILNRCYGAGGGGSGGAIYFNGSVPAVTNTVNGGAMGPNTSVNGCGVPVLATAGTVGSVISNYTYKSSTSPSSVCENLLPVKLIYFNAMLTSSKKAKLDWQIANPRDAAFFFVEKLSSSGTWIRIATIPANDANRFYSFIDDHTIYGENMYRLYMEGKDRSASYSNQKRVILASGSSFNFYPNPATKKLTVSGNFTGDTRLQLTDISGRLILEKKIPSGPGQYELNLPSLPNGIYLLRSGMFTEKLMIRN